MLNWISAGAAIALMTTCAVAQKGQRLSAGCRKEVMQLFGIDRDAIRGCLRERIGQMPENCRNEIRERVATRRGEARGEAVHGGQELSYGNDTKQNLDYFGVAGKPDAPLVVFVHGGGWSIGDKRQGAGTKSEFYNDLGYAFASLT